MKPLFEIWKEYEIWNNEKFKVISIIKDNTKWVYYEVEWLCCMFCTERLLNIANKYKEWLYYAINILNNEIMNKYNN